MNYSNTAIMGMAVAASFGPCFYRWNPSPQRLFMARAGCGCWLAIQIQFCLRVGTMGIAGLVAQDLRARFSTPQILIRIVVIVVMIIPH